MLLRPLSFRRGLMQTLRRPPSSSLPGRPRTYPAHHYRCRPSPREHVVHPAPWWNVMQHYRGIHEMVCGTVPNSRGGDWHLLRACSAGMARLRAGPPLIPQPLHPVHEGTHHGGEWAATKPRRCNLCRGLMRTSGHNGPLCILGRGLLQTMQSLFLVWCVARQSLERCTVHLTRRWSRPHPRAASMV